MKVVFSVFILSLVFTSCNYEHEKYLNEVKEHRMFKDENFSKAGSPIPADDMYQFKGLNYFPVDTSFKVEAQLSKYAHPSYIQMNANEETPSMYQNIGALKFKLNGVDYALDAFLGNGDNLSRLFVPFNDLTNGKSTYGGGRYLYAIKTSDNNYMLDFNYAHNPYCAYNEAYSCPVPPKQNFVKINVFVGEKRLVVE